MITLDLLWVVVQVINYIMSVVECLTFWFRNNCVKVNPDKFHLLFSDKKIHQVDICGEYAFKYVQWNAFGDKNWL